MERARLAVIRVGTLEDLTSEVMDMPDLFSEPGRPDFRDRQVSTARGMIQMRQQADAERSARTASSAAVPSAAAPSPGQAGPMLPGRPGQVDAGGSDERVAPPPDSAGLASVQQGGPGPEVGSGCHATVCGVPRAR